MEWDAPAIVLDVRPYGEGDALATVMTEAHGAHRGLARGGASRAQAGVWQAGNLAQVRWVARLSDQLGSFTAELIHPAAALAMDDPLALALLTSACAVAAGALADREPHPRVFAGLLGLIARLGGATGAASLAELVRWEAGLLAELGYGLDIAACAVTGATENLAYVSPRTGRAVSAAAAGIWKERLLPLPGFLARDPALPPLPLAGEGRGEGETGPAAPSPHPSPAGGSGGAFADCRDGLALTGHFLARDAFGLHHKPLPQARAMLYDRVAALALTETPPDAG